MDQILQGLVDKIKQSGIAYELPRIEEAYEFARAAHEGQMRRSGEPYVSHPTAVAEILVDLGLDTDSVIGGLLHDVVEDTPIELAVIEKQFGSDVARLVDGVTKLGRIPYSSREEQQSENIRKMLLAMAKDVRVILIKLADRLHNMRTACFWPHDKQLEKAFETMEVYAPIAHRLGIRTIKDELEDIALRYLDPVAYHEIEILLDKGREEREALLRSIQERIADRLSTSGISVHIEGRVKSVYGIYRKIYMHGRSFDEIYDIYAVRVIVDTVNDCYNVLGIIHDLMKPIPGRFKDYISTPKPNMYQSLHTTVLGKEGIPFEVQIRTWEMHYTAEYGIAAHWKYKLGISGASGTLDQRLAWVRQLLEMQQEFKDAEDIMRTLKTDLAPDEVFVFTPRGDVINLPLGSTPIDFAYAIHSAVGNRMTGAKVDGRIVPIDYQLKTGEIVEVLTTSSASHGPSRDWLKLARTSEARNKIRAWFKRERRDENIAEGRAETEREFKRNGIALDEGQTPEFLLDVAKRLHFNTAEEFLAAIGYGGIVLSKIMPRIKEEYLKTVKPVSIQIPDGAAPQQRGTGGVIVEGLENCLVKMARCCNPVPGDRITGFITRGFGVSVHKADCPNVTRNMGQPEYEGRWVNVHWAGNVSAPFKCSLQIVCSNRQGMLADISSQLASMHVMIHTVNSRELKDHRAVMTFVIDVTSTEHLQNVITRLSKITGVDSIGRSGG